MLSPVRLHAMADELVKTFDKDPILDVFMIDSTASKQLCYVTFCLLRRDRSPGLRKTRYKEFASGDDIIGGVGCEEIT